MPSFNHILILFTALVFSYSSMASNISIEFEQPVLDVNPYHKPYVAIWLETPKRKGIETLMLWHEKDDWLKDLRQWWRKLGRNSTGFDGITSATHKPGTYHLDKKITELKGQFYICLEAAREDGGRDFIKQKITLGDNKPQTYELHGKYELGNIVITIK